MSRLSSTSDSASGVADCAYTCLGASTIAVEDHPQAGSKLNYDPAANHSC